MNGKGERIFESLTDIENEAIMDNFTDARDTSRLHRQWRMIVMGALCAALLALGIYLAVRFS